MAHARVGSAARTRCHRLLLHRALLRKPRLRPLAHRFDPLARLCKPSARRMAGSQFDVPQRRAGRSSSSTKSTGPTSRSSPTAAGSSQATVTGLHPPATGSLPVNGIHLAEAQSVQALSAMRVVSTRIAPARNQRHRYGDHCRDFDQTQHAGPRHPVGDGGAPGGTCWESRRCWLGWACPAG